MGFRIDGWDILTFIVLLLLIIVFLTIVVLVLGLPGRIAIARKHPDADAVNIMGWLGFMAVVPWIQAFMWAFKPTDVIDIRRYPEQEQEHIKEMIAELKSKAASGKHQAPRSASGPPDESGA